jgi:hypothetical protein
VADDHRLAPIGGDGAAIGAVIADEADFLRIQPLAVLVPIGLVNHHALREHPVERFGKLQMAGIGHGAHEEARIEQMQDRVFDAANILIDGQPIGDGFAVHGF